MFDFSNCIRLECKYFLPTIKLKYDAHPHIAIFKLSSKKETLTHGCLHFWPEAKTMGQHSDRQIVQSLVSSRPYCCNSLLQGLPKYQLARLQRVENASARVIACVPRHEQISEIRMQLTGFIQCFAADIPCGTRRCSWIFIWATGAA